MSDNKLITGGLRERLKLARSWPSEYRAKELLAECDNIDVIHKKLENENEQLRKKLKERPIAGDAEVMAFVERLSDAADKREDVTLWGVDYMPYPVDADGVAIHLDDQLVTVTNGTLTWAASIERFSHGWRIHDNTCNYGSPDCYRHHHEPNVEDVLREFVTEFNRDDTELCDDEIIERFAKRLQLADGDAE